MTPGTKVRTKVAIRDSVVDVPQGAEGVVLATHPNLRLPVEVQISDGQICCYRPDELEIVK